MQDQMQECIESCMRCSAVCTSTSRYCLNQGGDHVNATHMTLMQDCAEICTMATSYMLRNSEFARQLCQLCADICDRCAESCEAIGGDTMQDCATTCRACADACRTMATATAA